MGTNTALPCRMVHDTDIVELELRSKRFSLAVRKKEAIEALEPQVVYQVCWQPPHNASWSTEGLSTLQRAGQNQC